jgi:hypothetical protein
LVLDPKSHVTTDLQRHLLLTITLSLVGGIVGAVYGWMRMPEVLGYVWLGTGLGLVVLSFYLSGAHEWARVSVGLLATVVALAHVIAVMNVEKENREFIPSIASLTFAAYFWLPSTREIFREAREALVKERDEKRRQRIKAQRAEL